MMHYSHRIISNFLKKALTESILAVIILYVAGKVRQRERMWRNGRRTRLKILRGRPRVGSSPTIRIRAESREALE